MFEKSNLPAVINYFLQPGYITVPEKPTMVSTVLGSCVSVCLYDRKKKFGGINHFQLPHSEDENKTTARFGNAATIGLIRMMLRRGAQPRHMEAQIFGGAHNPQFTTDIGRMNVIAAKKILAKALIRVTSEDVGGERGRKLVFNTGTNEALVMRVEKLRTDDWFPYEGSR